jgi:hypothetical protein
MDVYLLLELCVVRSRTVCWADHFTRGVLSSGVRVCLSECDRETSIQSRLWPTRGYRIIEICIYIYIYEGKSAIFVDFDLKISVLV